MSVYYFGEGLPGKLIWYNQFICTIAINIILLCLLYVYSHGTVVVLPLEVFSSMKVQQRENSSLEVCKYIVDCAQINQHCELKVSVLKEALT